MTKASSTPRSQPARDRIAAAAREVFATIGYDRATVRLIAERASVVPAMVIRYFGSKEDLFATTVQVDLQLPDLSSLAVGERGTTLVAHFLARWEGPDHRGDLSALLHASADHAEARERMIAIFSSQLARVMGNHGGEHGAAQRAALVATQMLGLAYCRYVLKLPAVVALPSKVVIDEIGATVERYLAVDADADR